jgi:diaminopimelate epimerase
MKLTIPFEKMHGLGNDFVIISEEAVPGDISKEQLAVIIADRKLGIGCDQFITYEKYDGFIKMSIYNHDGSIAKACGNASRCLSRLIFEQTGKQDIILDVQGRKVTCRYHNSAQIKVNMGAVSFKEKWMPNKDQLWSLAQKYMIEPKEMMCVDVANPHLVIFTKLSDQDQKIIGRNFQNLDLFPTGINVNFAKIEDNRIYLKVWERGAGFTYACGSGAVATFAAAHQLGFTDSEAEVMFKLGSLKMFKDKECINMTGPASSILHGEYIYG